MPRTVTYPLARKLKQHGITQAALAAALSVPAPQVSRWVARPVMFRSTAQRIDNAIMALCQSAKGAVAVLALLAGLAFASPAQAQTKDIDPRWITTIRTDSGFVYVDAKTFTPVGQTVTYWTLWTENGKPVWTVKRVANCATREEALLSTIDKDHNREDREAEFRSPAPASVSEMLLNAACDADFQRLARRRAASNRQSS